MATRRQQRVAQELKQALGEILTQELTDPRLGFMTVTRVETSPDLRSAKVYVSVLGEDVDERRTLHGLEHARGHIQHSLGDKVVLRTTPVLRFVIDDSVKRSVRMSRLIDSEDSEVQ